MKEEARKFFEKENTLKATRKTLEDKLFLDQDLWNKVVALGWTGITIPEEYDGLGLGHLELCVLAEEMGKVLAPIPFSSSVYLFTEAINKFASEDIKKGNSTEIGNRKIVGTLGVTEDLRPNRRKYINFFK